ncbi:succinylglutamate desuccinylase/aspartoacylase domain-containing protein [Enterobacter roggenkampii]|uniref:succinylglutamate desuccinylase/aspartoacylase domain-containing protein n=1 Tax=Enterobacter roggenkampii TaxID=1812935 RepID=UPI00351ACA9D
MVAKGKTDGKNVLLQAGVHGDELNGVRIVQKVMEQLDPAKMNGSVIGIIGPNRSGLERVSRTWSVSTDGVRRSTTTACIQEKKRVTLPSVRHG